MITIGIVGTRSRDSLSVDFPKVKEAFLKVQQDGCFLVSGGCPQGADRFAELIAKHEQIPITIHYARWKKFGKAAGFMRNGDIAEDAHILIACVASDRTGGTEDIIEKFLRWHRLTEAEAIEKGKLILV